MSGPYDDILHLPHPVSSRHAPMSRADRAAQFSPFAALTGYDAAIEETGRLTDPETEPDEQDKLLLRHALQQFSGLLQNMTEMAFIRAVYNLVRIVQYHTFNGSGTYVQSNSQGFSSFSLSAI